MPGAPYSNPARMHERQGLCLFPRHGLAPSGVPASGRLPSERPSPSSSVPSWEPVQADTCRRRLSPHVSLPPGRYSKKPALLNVPVQQGGLWGLSFCGGFPGSIGMDINHINPVTRAGGGRQKPAAVQNPPKIQKAVNGGARSAPFILTINSPDRICSPLPGGEMCYSSLNRSILKITGLVPSEQQVIIVFSSFIHPFIIEPP